MFYYRTREKIKFKNRIEFRVSGQLHNTLGPALIELEPEKNRYYIRNLSISIDELESYLYKITDKENEKE